VMSPISMLKLDLPKGKPCASSSSSSIMLAKLELDYTTQDWFE